MSVHGPYLDLNLVSRVIHPSFGLRLDFGRAHWASSHPAEEWLKNLYSYIRRLHLHDNHGNRDEHLGWDREISPGM